MLQMPFIINLFMGDAIKCNKMQLKKVFVNLRVGDTYQWVDFGIRCVVGFLWSYLEWVERRKLQVNTVFHGLVN